MPATGELCGLLLDERQVIAAASEGCEKLFDRRAEELVGLPAKQVFYDLPALEASSGSLCLHARRLGRPRLARIFWCRSGKAVSLVLIDLERILTDEFAHSAAVARLSSELVHEVRNPLSSVKMIVQAFGRDLPDERFSRRFAIALREVRAIERIASAVSGMLRVPSAERSLDLSARLSGLFEKLRKDLEQRGLGLRLSVAAELPALELDFDRLALAIDQLVGVLSHGLESGEVVVEAGPMAQAPGFLLRLSALPAPSWRPSGSSLSIALARRIASEHGGVLHDEPEGAFRIEMPLGARGAGVRDHSEVICTRAEGRRGGELSSG